MRHRLLSAFFISLLLGLIIFPVFPQKVAFAASSCPSSPIPNPQKPIAIAVCLTNNGNPISNPSGYKVTVKNSFNGTNHTYQTTYSSSGQVYFTTAVISGLEGDINPTACFGTTLDPYNLTITATKGSSGPYISNVDGSSLCGNLHPDFAYVENVTVSKSASSTQYGGININKSCVTYTAQDGSTQPYDGTSGTTPATATITGPNNSTYRSGYTSKGCLSNTLLESSMPVGSYKIVANYTPGDNANGDTQSQSFISTFTISAGKQTVVSGKATSAAGATATNNTTNNQNGGSVPSLSCNAGFNPLNWLICGVINGLVGIIGDVDNLITGLLSVGSGNGSSNPSAIFCSSQTQSKDQKACNDYYSAWSEFRDIALGLLVLIGLVIIITEATGLEVIDAYTLRKVLPRLVFATIAITLSWQLMRLFVELTNALGFGVRYLIYEPFVHLQNSMDLGGGGGVAISLASGAAITAMGIFGLLSFVATAALAVFVAFIVLVLRQLVIIMLIILAPIAILAYILPNTQNVYKIWWDSFSKALLMFPLIVGLIAIGRVFAAVTLTQDNSSAISNIIAFAAYFAPYFAIPFTVRLAGGAMSRIGGMVHNANRGAYGALSNFRRGQLGQNMQDLRAGTRFNEDHIAAPLTSRFNRLSRGAANVGEIGTNPFRMRSRMQAAVSTQEYLRAKEDMEKNGAVQAILGNDDYDDAIAHSIRTQGRVTDAGVREHLAGVTDNNGNRLYTGRALEQGVGAIRQARHSTSSEALGIAAAIANAGTGTGYGGGAGEMYAAINDVAGGDRHLAARMLVDARGAAERARRVDLNGNGYGQSGQLMQAMFEGNATAAEASATAADTALTIQGVSAVMNARGNAVQNLVPHLTQRVVTAQNDLIAATAAHGTGSIEHLQAQDNLDRQLATVAGLYDSAAYAAPEVSEALATVMGTGVMVGGRNGSPVTIRRMVEDTRARAEAQGGNHTFLENRREIGQQAAVAAQNAQNMQPPPPPPQA